MAQRSAGIILHRPGNSTIEVFLVHPGGPFWAKKDDGAWSIPKGLYKAGEDPLDAARREFEEEVGVPIWTNALMVAAGFYVAVWNRTPERARAIAGARPALTPADACAELPGRRGRAGPLRRRPGAGL